jgi:hypothetical protein
MKERWLWQTMAPDSIRLVQSWPWAGEHNFEFVAKCELEGSARVATAMRVNGG